MRPGLGSPATKGRLAMRNMTTMAALALAVALLGSACGGGGNTAPPAAAPVSVENAGSRSQPVPVGAAKKVNAEWWIKVNDVPAVATYRLDMYMPAVAEPGAVFLLVNITATRYSGNQGNVSQPPSGFGIATASRVIGEHCCDGGLPEGKNPFPSRDKYFPGGAATGWLIFQVPEDDLDGALFAFGITSQTFFDLPAVERDGTSPSEGAGATTAAPATTRAPPATAPAVTTMTTLPADLVSLPGYE